ncbi:MAG: efflux RND transporter permease subunit, partial [Bacteroidota bacterium]
VIYQNDEFGIRTRIQDVAEVRYGTKKPDVICRLDGKPSIVLEVKKQSDANAVNVSNQVRSEIKRLENKLEIPELEIEITQDISQFTRKAVQSVSEDLGLAIILVSLIMLLFLHSLKNATIVFFSIPICILSTFTVMYFLGYTLNLLSLLGLSLAIGILVDDSIVVIENIYRHITMGKSSKDASYIGRMEIGNAAISITLIDVVVFLPLVFSDGMVADLLREFAVVIVASTLMSLLVSFTLVPYLASRFHRNAGKPQAYMIFQQIDRWLESLTDEIAKLLKWSLGHKLSVIFVILVLAAATGALFAFRLIGVEFTKSGDRSEFILELSFENGISLEAATLAAMKAESILLGFSDVENVLTKVGIGSRGRITIEDPSLAEMYVRLVDKSSRNYSSAQFARHAKYALMDQLAGLHVTPIDINIIGLRDDDAVQVTISSTDENELSQINTKVSEILKETKGAVEIKSSMDDGTLSIVALPERNRMQAFKLDQARVGFTMRTALSGDNTSKYFLKDEILPIRIKMKSNEIENIEGLKKVTVINDEGKLVALDEILRFKAQRLNSRLERTNRSRSVTIQSQVFGRPAGSVSRSFQTRIQESGLANKASFTYGGATKRTSEGILSMVGALAVSIILVYSVLVLLYNSYAVPLIVLVSLPLALVGAFLALALTGEALSIFSIMGLIILAGLVGKNAILVVDVARAKIKEGNTSLDAFLTATRLRLRPILMTNLTMIIGLLPIALSSSAGSEWKNGLAWALIGGLFSSMLLSLIVVPVFYDLALSIKHSIQYRSK